MEKKNASNEEKNIQIVILPQGWVLIGEYSEQVENGTLIAYLRNSSVVRRWGTTHGLGQIAISGPTTETVFDPCGVSSFPVAQMVSKIKVEAKFIIK